ncbi:hypothetical protein ACHAPJ_011765 [Fusarium lateritium]
MSTTEENDTRGPLDIVRAFTTTTAQKPPLTETRRIVLGDGYHALSLEGGYFSLQLSVALDKVEQSAGIQQGSFTYEGRTINLGDPEPEVWIDDKIAVVWTGTKRLSPEQELLGRSLSIFTLLRVNGDWKLAGAASTQLSIERPPLTISTEITPDLLDSLERLKKANQDGNWEGSEKLVLRKAGGTWFVQPGEPQHELLEEHIRGATGWFGLPLDREVEESFDEFKIRVSDATALVWARFTVKSGGDLIRKGVNAITLYWIDEIWVVAHSAVFAQDV